MPVGLDTDDVDEIKDMALHQAGISEVDPVENDGTFQKSHFSGQNRRTRCRGSFVFRAGGNPDRLQRHRQAEKSGSGRSTTVPEPLQQRLVLTTVRRGGPILPST
jgi:hypothetical protein